MWLPLCAAEAHQSLTASQHSSAAQWCRLSAAKCVLGALPRELVLGCVIKC